MKNEFTIYRDGKAMPLAPEERKAPNQMITNAAALAESKTTTKGILQFKELKGYAGKILAYCHKVEHYNSMLNALDADLALEQYLDLQPGGGNCVKQNRSAAVAYEHRLNELSSESVFGSLYEKANSEEKRALDALLDVCARQYFDGCFEEIIPTYQMMKFMELVCELDFAEKEFTAEDVTLLKEGGNYFRTLVDDSWNPEKGVFTFAPDVDTAKTFLTKAHLCKN